MRLSISNIAWDTEKNDIVYGLMREYGFGGLEIAPTKIFVENPYDRLSEAKAWSDELREKYGFTVPSMQSIWYGRTEKLFGTDAERAALTAYTKKAVDFAEAIGCGNLVFGCPKNRNAGNAADLGLAVGFFRELGNYAHAHGTAIGMEANPAIYNTDYINDTLSALRLVDEVGSEGFKLNLDIGTMLENKESVDILRGNIALVSHVHISEPYLKPIEKRDIHREVLEILKSEGYNGFVSIEMGLQEDIGVIEEKLGYMRGIANG